MTNQRRMRFVDMPDSQCTGPLFDEISKYEATHVVAIMPDEGKGQNSVSINLFVVSDQGLKSLQRMALGSAPNCPGSRR